MEVKLSTTGELSLRLQLRLRKLSYKLELEITITITEVKLEVRVSQCRRAATVLAQPRLLVTASEPSHHLDHWKLSSRTKLQSTESVLSERWALQYHKDYASLQYHRKASTR